MNPLGWIPSTLRLPLTRRRRHWRTDGRVHIETRDLRDGDMAAFAAEVVAALEQLPGVDWAYVVAPVRRVVVALTEPEPETADVVAVIDAVECRLGAERVGFARAGPEHPADIEPIVRDFLALGADVIGLGFGLVGAARRFSPLPIEIDVAALVSVVEGAPKVRHIVEDRVGYPAADLALGVANAIAQGFAQGPLGPIVDLAHRVILYRELVARREQWARREPMLVATRPVGGLVEDLTQPRVAPLPSGPIERYADEAWYASAVGFGVVLVATRRVERAVAALYAGLPKAARLGRETFAAQVGALFASRGILVVNSIALRRLDRVDRLVLDVDVDVPDVVASAARVGLKPARAESPDQVVQLQQGGHVVAYAGRDARMLGAADVAMGFCDLGAVAPWHADIVANEPVRDVFLLCCAIGAANEVSRQSVRLAMAGAGTAAFVALGGIVPGTTHRATTVVNLATATAMANGVRHAIDLARLPEPRRADEPAWHALEIDEVMTRLGTSRTGLLPDEAARRVLPSPTAPRPLVVFGRSILSELASPLTPVLAGGAALSAMVGSLPDALMVTSVMGVNAIVGGVQRLRTDRAIARLTHVGRRTVTVRRNGEELAVDSRQLVLGDVVRLHAGDIVPADCRIVTGGHVEADESALTGESLPVVKRNEATTSHAVADRTSMLYDGTAIAAGDVEAVVVAIGDDTEARRSLLLVGAPPETGVESRLRSLTALAIPASLVSGIGVVGAGLLRGVPLRETLGAGVSLAVAAVPEGLPVLATVAQLGAARRLSGRGVLVRNPRAIEALGRVDVLCADKTGTLTEGHISLRLVSDGESARTADELTPGLEHVLAAARRATPAPTGDGDVAHPTDRAVLEATGVDVAGWRPVDELPFEPGRGFHAVVGELSGERTLAVKGAPEVVLPRCTAWRGEHGLVVIDDGDRARLDIESRRLARLGLRVLAVAERDADRLRPLTEDRVARLIFVGFVALSDPPRATSAEAIGKLRRANVDVIMITGDHPSTAEGIAVELGLLGEGDAVISGSDVDTLDDAALRAIVPRTKVFARVTPMHKVRIVHALQRAGRTVAMTGDGANDAAAIRLADVGIALGPRSTPAARDAADVVVTDEHIETIADAVAEGRAMWGSVRDAVAVLLGGNLGELGFVLLGTLATGRSPLNARQLLLVNLLTDAAPAMAIALRRPDPRATDAWLREGPDASLGRTLNEQIAWRGLATTAGATTGWVAARFTGRPRRASTVALAALVGTQLGQTLVVGDRDPLVTVTALGSTALLCAIVQTPGVSQLFGCTPLGPVGWMTATTSATAATVGAVVGPRVMSFIARAAPALAAPEPERVSALVPT
jgi:cation-transporting ATPase I